MSDNASAMPTDDDIDLADDEPSAERAARRARDGQLVRAVRAGDQGAFAQLFDDWFDAVHDLARRIVRRADVADEVAQEAFLNAWNRLDSLETPEAFGGWLLRIARNGALNRHEREARSSAVDDEAMAMIELHGGAGAGAPAGFAVEDRFGRISNPTVVVEDNELVDLVWQAAAALPARDLEVLDLQLRHGLAPAEIGDLLGMNRNAANQLVHRLRGRLEGAIRARVLWRSGEPVCAGLASQLDAALITVFDGDAVKVIEKHAKNCLECDERQKSRLKPTALFAALPILVAPMLTKQEAAAALISHGVPVQGSAACAGSAATSGGTSAGGSSGSSAGTSSGTSGTSGTGGTGSAATAAGPAVATAAYVNETDPAIAAAARNSTRRRVLAGVGVVVVLVVLGIGLGPVLAGRRADLPPEAITATGTLVPLDESSRTTGPADTTEQPGPGISVGPTTPTSAGRSSTTPSTTPSTNSTPSTTTTTALAPVTATLTLRPASSGPRWSMTAAPTLTWSVTGAGATGATATVSGPGVKGSGLSGSTPVCPGSVVRNFCTATPGTYTYTLTVTGSDGRPRATKTASLTVTEAPNTTTTMPPIP